MRLLLVDPNEALVAAWRAQDWGRGGSVRIELGVFEDFKADAIVSPANSRGIMSGGIDAAYVRFFGRPLQTATQRAIREKWSGNLPVGSAIGVKTSSRAYPLMVCAPTMRVPGTALLGPLALNPFIAFRAALLCAHRSGARTVAAPGMGTGVGRVPYDVAARQMAYAWKTWDRPRLWSLWFRWRYQR